MKVAFHTLGCKVNQYETEAIKETFIKRGAEIASEDSPADAYIVNTCTVTGIADRKSRQYIRKMKRNSPHAIMVVTGCYAQVASEELSKMKDIDLIIGNNLKASICDKVFALAKKREEERHNENHENVKDPGNDSENVFKVEVLSREMLTGYEDLGCIDASASLMNRSYIKIEEGCDRFCSYCMIPYARGTVRSRKEDDIFREAERLISNGVREVVLTGINTALYGTEAGFDYFGKSLEDDASSDNKSSAALASLIDRVGGIDGNFRIRLSSLEPTVVDARNVKRLLGSEKLCHHLHLSLQSGSNRILNKMNRHYSREEYLEIVEALRNFDPCYGITTDIIVGFPGETDEDFADTLDMVSKVGFGRVHAFKYSPRKGTVAAGMTDRVHGDIKNERIKELIKRASASANAFNEKNYLGLQKVLIEEHIDGYALGYTDNYIKVYIEDAENKIPLNEFSDIKLIDNKEDGCLGRLAEKGR